MEQMETVAYSVIKYVLVAGCAPAAAALIPVFFLRQGLNAKYVKIVLCISAGLLFAISTLDLIPEAIEMGTEHSHAESDATTASKADDHALLSVESTNIRATMYGVGCGFCLLLSIEFLLTSLGNTHVHGVLASDQHRSDDRHEADSKVENDVGTPAAATGSVPTLSNQFTLIAFLGLAVHSLVDGLVIASGFVASTAIGSRVALAIVIHKFPDGFVLSSLASSQGPISRKSLYIILAVVGMTPVGALLGALLLGHIPSVVLPFVLGCGAGTFLFISASAILPELLHMKPVRLADVGFVVAGYVCYLLVESISGVHPH